jgi:putative peptidoglycan binding protein/CHAP domain-containing protein
MASRRFPGRIIKKGDPDASIVKAIQRQLNARGCGPIDVDGGFGDQTDAAVRLFQARFPDVEGIPLLVDGKVGSITWAALFGEGTVPSADEAPSPLLQKTLEIAKSQIGVMEQPPGSNRGPEVDEYLRRVGLNPKGHFAWCVAFLYFCFDEAAKALDRSNPVIKTAGVLDHWAKAGQQGVPRITHARAVQNPGLVLPGHIFIIDTGNPGGGGHSGVVQEVAGGKIITIEGNTNVDGSAEGIGVFRRESRKIAQINKGFIDYSAA